MACSPHCAPRRARARNGQGSARRGVRPLGARQAAARRGADRVQHIARPRAGADRACARRRRGRRSGTGTRRSRARAAPRAHRDCGGGAESCRAVRGRRGRALSAGLGAAARPSPRPRETASAGSSPGSASAATALARTRIFVPGWTASSQRRRWARPATLRSAKACSRRSLRARAQAIPEVFRLPEGKSAVAALLA